jgi:hypothetical protein
MLHTEELLAEPIQVLAVVEAQQSPRPPKLEELVDQDLFALDTLEHFVQQ